MAAAAAADAAVAATFAPGATPLAAPLNETSSTGVMSSPPSSPPPSGSGGRLEITTPGGCGLATLGCCQNDCGRALCFIGKGSKSIGGKNAFMTENKDNKDNSGVECWKSTFVFLACLLDVEKPGQSCLGLKVSLSTSSKLVWL